jgi:hypothetical protein
MPKPLRFLGLEQGLWGRWTTFHQMQKPFKGALLGSVFAFALKFSGVSALCLAGLRCVSRSHVPQGSGPCAKDSQTLGLGALHQGLWRPQGDDVSSIPQEGVHRLIWWLP